MTILRAGSCATTSRRSRSAYRPSCDRLCSECTKSGDLIAPERLHRSAQLAGIVVLCQHVREETTGALEDRAQHEAFGRAELPDLGERVLGQQLDEAFAVPRVPRSGGTVEEDHDCEAMVRPELQHLAAGIVHRLAAQRRA